MDDAEEAMGVTARELCDGTLSVDAAGALGRLSGAEAFTELTGTNAAGEPNTFSVTRSVAHLHDETTERSSCAIYEATEGSDQPLLEIDFLAVREHPQPFTEFDGELAPFPVGAYAATGRYGADLYFTCPTTGSGDSLIGDTRFVRGQMYSALHPLRDEATARDHMVILNSVARKVADAAGCAAQARLPAKVPPM
ncbi:hypothetical protein ACWC10_07315 [Streptomyces sp. NPDC001595]|uniref:hypothetical protein n=1 Tax=Streptomyces sp. NPDC001532 TaxID=3154520 RepID=UPI00332F27FF